MNYPKLIVSSQKEESISIQRVKVCFLVPFLQDNIKLKSQVHGQESVIEGLRAERKLWGQELAQQGWQRVGMILVLHQYHRGGSRISEKWLICRKGWGLILLILSHFS